MIIELTDIRETFKKIQSDYDISNDELKLGIDDIWKYRKNIDNTKEDTLHSFLRRTDKRTMKDKNITLFFRGLEKAVIKKFNPDNDIHKIFKIQNDFEKLLYKFNVHEEQICNRAMDNIYLLNKRDFYILNKYFDNFKRIDDKCYSIICIFDHLTAKGKDIFIKKTSELTQDIPQLELSAESIRDISAFCSLSLFQNYLMADDIYGVDIKEYKADFQAKMDNAFFQEPDFKYSVFSRIFYNITNKGFDCWGYLAMYKILSLSADKENDLISFIKNMLSDGIENEKNGKDIFCRKEYDSQYSSLKSVLSDLQRLFKHSLLR